MYFDQGWDISAAVLEDSGSEVIDYRVEIVQQFRCQVSSQDSRSVFTQHM